MDQAYTSPRRALLNEFRDSDTVRQLFKRGVLELDSVQGAEDKGHPQDTGRRSSSMGDLQMWDGFPRSYQPVLYASPSQQLIRMFEP
jgi:hypothetical protein